ncbi:MAG: hypothetical protein M8357_14375 [Desulfobulbaceae bacterium]|nr:hypothetical protein [Desulfobulbaceae bacterium]
MTAIQDAMAAVAYAEEGEFDTAREILGPEDEKKKRVILGIDDLEIKPKLIKYASELSQRVGGKLEVLQFIPPSTPDCAFASMHNQKVELKKEMGIAYKIITAPGTVEEDLLAYARKKRNILLVLLKSIDNGEKTINIMHVMAKLNCPVVVFSEIM